MPDLDFNVTDPIFAWASRFPNAVAIIEQGQAISYRRLGVAVRHAMQQYRRAGWREGDVIGVSIRGSSALYLVVVLALARMGVTQVALSPDDLVARRLSIAQVLGIRAVITNHEDKRLDTLAHLTPESDWLSAADTALAPDSRSPGGDGIWLINQSSGTTGEPKNIAISHERFRIWSRRLQPILGVLPGERFANLIGLRFWMGLWWAMCCLSEGGAIVALPEKFSTDQLLHWIDLYDITYLQCTPSHLHGLVQGVRGDAPRLPGLRILRCGTAALAPSLLRDARVRLTPNVFCTYGVNETATLTVATPAILDRFPDSVGLPFAGVDLEIVDAEDLCVPAGTVGRVRVRCDGGIAAIDGVVSMDNWFYPGDIASRNGDGIVFLKGRYDDVMNFDGILISPVEIEAVLARHPHIADVAAFPLPSPQHQDLPAAALVLRRALPMDEINRYCAQHLGIRAPKLFILVDELPRNDMGKVLRRRLTEMALAGLAAKANPEMKEG